MSSTRPNPTRRVALRAVSSLVIALVAVAALATAPGAIGHVADTRSGPTALVRIADEDPPLAARLLEQPYETTGTRVQVTNLPQLRGLANDGVNVYGIDASGNVTVVPFSAIDITPGGSVSLAGTTHTVNWGQDGAPALPNMGQLSLAYSHGCLWITNDSNTVGEIRLYCIDVSTFTVSEVAVPGDHPLPEGNYYVRSSLIDFPDGRVGKVSKYEPTEGGYLSTLRTYTVSGTGSAATITWSLDYTMFDPQNFAVDEHGIATDGTYLYRIQWRDYNPNTKVWALSSESSGQPVYSGNYTMPFGNMHFLSHDHAANRYLVGHWDAQSFFITTEADPGPGPGNPLVPTFGAVTPTADGFTAQITNFDAEFAWSGTATTGAVWIGDSGLVTVTGVAANTASTVTVATTRNGFPDGSGDVSGTSLETPPTTTTTTTTTTTSTTTTTTAAPTTTVTPTTAPPITPPISPPPTGPPAGSATAPDAPVPLPDGELPRPAAGQAVLMIDGRLEPVTVSTSSNPAGVTVTGDGFTMTIAGVDAQGNRLPLTANGNVQVEPGRYVRVAGTGFAPGSTVEVWLFSTPIHLGRLGVGSDGTFTGQLQIPLDVPVGVHTLQANGMTVDGAERSVSLRVEVDPAAATTLAFTGGSDPRVALVVALLLLVMGAAMLVSPIARPVRPAAIDRHQEPRTR